MSFSNAFVNLLSSLDQRQLFVQLALDSSAANGFNIAVQYSLLKTCFLTSYRYDQSKYIYTPSSYSLGEFASTFIVRCFFLCPYYYCHYYYHVGISRTILSLHSFKSCFKPYQSLKKIRPMVGLSYLLT